VQAPYLKKMSIIRKVRFLSRLADLFQGGIGLHRVAIVIVL
jgi:hypothetical protein